jgi:hypothetical protein
MDRIKLLNIRGVLQARQGDLLNNYAVVLRRNNRRRQARSIEARGAAIQVDGRRATIVDITELLPTDKPVKK